MAGPKTKESRASVPAFVAAIPDAAKRADLKAAIAMLRRVTGEPPRLWGTNIVGFGHRTMTYASGRELDWPVVAVASRKDRTTLYLPGALERHRDLLERLGKHSRGKGCLHVRRLGDVDGEVLEALARRAVTEGDAAGAQKRR